MYVRSCSRLPELAQVIKDHAPDAIKIGEIKNHFGRKVAIVRLQLILIMRNTDSHLGCVRSSLIFEIAVT